MAATVHNAGAIFCGPWSPASIGDYLAGPSHVLPTHGSARFASALTVDDFLEAIRNVSKSVSQAQLDEYQQWMAEFGSV